VIGFDDQGDLRRNEALIFAANDAEPLLYFKRHMVPGLEAAFVPGDLPLVLQDRTGVAICKDMDFQSTLRSDARDGHPMLSRRAGVGISTAMVGGTRGLQ